METTNPILLDIESSAIFLISLMMLGCHKWGQTPSWWAGGQIWFFPQSANFWLCAHRGASYCDNSLLETNWFPQVSSCRLLMVAIWRVPRTRESIKCLLQSFWNCYQKEHPEHLVFQHPERLSRTFPITIHGDGGRTQKKNPLEVFSFQPVLGLSTAASEKSATMTCHCDTSAEYGGADFRDPFAQRLNSKFSTYLTHFLLFAFPSKSYATFDNILVGLLTTIMDDLAVACKEGIMSGCGQRFYPACVGFKLDMEWMVKVGSLVRSYQNVGHVNYKNCCHMCDAGERGIPFEDVNENAVWTRTRYNTIPWQNEPPWRNIPFDNTKPAKFLRRDAFHIFRQGIGRNYIASCVYLLIYMGCSWHMLMGNCFGCLCSVFLAEKNDRNTFKFDGLTGYDLGSSSLSGSIGCNLKGFPPLATDPGFLEDSDNQMPTCLKRAFSNLKLYCMANGLQVAGIRNFTVQNMHAARNAFPWVGCKGSDTIVILKWLSFYGSLQLQQEGWSPKNQQLLRWIVAGAKGGLSFGQGIHGHGIWLAPSCVSHLKRAVQKFGSAYAYLAHHYLITTASLDKCQSCTLGCTTEKNVRTLWIRGENTNSIRPSSITVWAKIS